MESGTTCPICFADYTVDGTHYPVSLKCGHLFGNECIVKWMTQNKKNFCPSCSEPIKKMQIRKIFATKIIAYDQGKEHEYLEKYLREQNERKLLENKIESLETQIEIMKMNMKKCSEATFSKYHKEFVAYSKIHFYPDDSIICYDSLNQTILISGSRNGHGIYKYFTHDTSFLSIIRTEFKIKQMKMSPFHDGLILVSYHKTLALINTYSEVFVWSFNSEYLILDFDFNKNSREEVFYCDSQGRVCIYNSLNLCHQNIKISSIAINHISQVNGELFASTLFEVFEIKYNSGLISYESVDLDFHGICTGLFSNGDILLVSFRDSIYNVSHKLIGAKNGDFDGHVKQLNRHIDKILNNHIIIADDYKKGIKIFDLKEFNMVHSIQFKEQIVGFDGDEKNLIILTRRGIYIYK